MDQQLKGGWWKSGGEPAKHNQLIGPKKVPSTKRDAKPQLLGEHGER